ncbi:hypothetical protein L3Y34_006229 [Caenorhabditis briggsae]|uniref:Uncharacterized protein n=1 Tax=Caenorhabditis briggsae TaxID=6238 RepID=A0AAE9CYM9_CAEBR|nr:hypothetical protein L3Y34_006229 [Caenorhabditis briggsae]
MCTFLKQLFYTSLFASVAIGLSVYVVIPLATQAENYMQHRSECSAVADSFDRRFNDFQESYMKMNLGSRSDLLIHRSTCGILGTCISALKNCSNIDISLLEYQEKTVNDCCDFGYHLFKKAIAYSKRDFELAERMMTRWEATGIKCEWFENFGILPASASRSATFLSLDILLSLFILFSC